MLDNDFEIILNNNETKQYWINQSFISEDLRNRLKDADVLIIPEYWRGSENKGFYSGTQPFYEYVKEHNKDINIQFCIEEKDYSILQLQSATFWIGKFIVESVALPLFISMLGEYLYNQLFHNSDDEVDIEITEQNNDGSITTLKYHGNYDKFVDLLKNQKEFLKLFKK